MNKNAGSNSEPKEEIIISKTGNQGNDLEKSKSNLKLTAYIQNAIQGKENNNVALRRDLLDNNHAIEKDLSDGEASIGFETVSSIDSKTDSDEIVVLNTPIDEDDINVIVQIDNKRGRRASYWKEKNKTLVRSSSRTEVSTHDYTDRKHDGLNTSKKEKYCQSRNNEKTYDRREKKTNDRDDFTGNLSSHDCDRSKSNIHCTRHRSTRGIDHGHRSRHISNREGSHRSRSSRSMERNIRVTSPGFKDRKTEARHSGNFEKSTTKSNGKRNSPPRKRRSSFSKSPNSPVWKRLDNRISPDRISSEKKSIRTPSRKKERTPFLVELERKLKEADRMKNLKNKTINGSLGGTEVPTNSNNAQPVPELPAGMNQNITPSYLPMCVPPPTNIPVVGFPLQYTPIPTLSVNNLPLVPGPSGMPVHITMTGEQIPHDLDGRPIPVGPNGYYLPLDPTGRLFPHIVSPGNQAVPIHMTEDGVLRLPNSDPVPYGPSHQLPVNVDGRIILIGPDSKPLFPCPNLPRQPPLEILNMMNSLGTEIAGLQRAIQTGISQTVNKETVGTELQQGQNNNDNFEPPKTNSPLEVVVQNPPQKTNKTVLLKTFKKKVRERCNDVLKPIKIGGHLDANPSKGGNEKSVPVKSSKKKTFKHACISGIDIILGSDSSDSTPDLKSRQKHNKDSVEEIVLSSDEEQDIFYTNFVKESTKSPTTAKEKKELIIKRVKQAIRSLRQKNYKPPALGRFIISNPEGSTVGRESPNESPLLRNQLLLPFLIPNDDSSNESDEVPRKMMDIFQSLRPEECGKGEKCSNVGADKTQNENLNVEKFPGFTFDFAVQCDLTSVTINNLTSKVAELEMEVVRLRNLNANLVDGCRNVEGMSQKKGDELRKALLEIKEGNNEMQSLKRSV